MRFSNACNCQAPLLDLVKICNPHAAPPLPLSRPALFFRRYSRIFWVFIRTLAEEPIDRPGGIAPFIPKRC